MHIVAWAIMSVMALCVGWSIVAGRVSSCASQAASTEAVDAGQDAKEAAKEVRAEFAVYAAEQRGILDVIALRLKTIDESQTKQQEQIEQLLDRSRNGGL